MLTPTPWQSLSYVLTVLPLFPLATCWWMERRYRTVHPVLWLIALGFAVSWAADSVGMELATRGYSTWWLTYVYVPIQFAMLTAAVTKPGPTLWLGAGTILLAGVLLALKGPLGRPELVLEVVAGAWVSFLAFGARSPGRRAIWAYCLIPIPFVLCLAVAPVGGTAWWVGWSGYQAARVLALGLLTAEVIHGRVERDSTAVGDREGGRHLRVVDSARRRSGPETPHTRAG